MIFKYTPFLTIYKGQYVNMSSILQRITGILLYFVSVIYVLINKLAFLCGFTYFLYYISFIMIKGNNIFLIGLLAMLCIFFIYHFIGGLRYIYWERTGSFENMYLAVKQSSMDNVIIIYFYIIIISNIIIWSILAK